MCAPDVPLPVLFLPMGLPAQELTASIPKILPVSEPIQTQIISRD